MYEENISVLERRISKAMDMLTDGCVAEELKTGEFEKIQSGPYQFCVKQYRIENVGNLSVMTCKSEGEMQLDSFTITPYLKNLPMLATDYMYFDGRRSFLNEIYNFGDARSEIYERYMGEFRENCSCLEDMPPLPQPEKWYSGLREAYVAKSSEPKDDDRILDVFFRNLGTFLRMEKETSLLDEKGKREKQLLNEQYVEHLVMDGGRSTSMFTKFIGKEKTKEFYRKIFFGCDMYA